MGAIELADARQWLRDRAGAGAAAVVYDPPYAVGTPVRGKDDGAAGSVFAPFGFLHETLRAAREALRDGGICIVFADWRRMADMGYLCSTVGLRPSTCSVSKHDLIDWPDVLKGELETWSDHDEIVLRLKPADACKAVKP